MKPQPSPAIAIMIAPDNQAEPAAADAANTQSIPLAALAVDGTEPAVGDDVEYTVRGKISRIDTGVAVVAPETINDQPAKIPETAEKEPTEESAMAAAQKADAEAPI